MRFKYRVTKYDPQFRDAAGVYRREEWTYFRQVGKKITGKVLTIREYSRTESAYLEVLRSMLEEAKLPFLEIRSLQIPREGGKKLAPWARRSRLSVAKAVEFARLALREELWGRLVLPGIAYVHFGWDYYMYVGLPVAVPTACALASSLGLFVEPFRSPYLRRR